MLLVILAIILSFSVLILIHELGHFVTAKRSGVWVEEFGLGLPPRLWGKKIGDTVYSINWLPIGGFVKLHGETSSDKVIYKEKAFTNKTKLQKIIITLAGIFMNFVLAVICFSAVFFFTGIPGKVNVLITNISEKSPAQASGIQKDDIIEKVNDRVITNDTDFIQEISNNKGKEITLTIKRENELIETKITPRVDPPAGEGSLGVQFAPNQESYFPPILERPFISVWHGLKQTVEVTKGVVLGLGSVAQSVSQGESPQGVTGPVGIISILKRIAEWGIVPLINLVGLISINLAIINLIPFPPLDGSRVLQVLIEWLTKKKMTPKMEERVYFAGFAILIGLTILITSREIPAVISSGGLNNYADTLLNQK